MAEPNDQGSFSDYPFAATILEDVAAAGYQAPTPIQAAFIPLALAGRDVIGLAQTGTGKTAAFALPIIERLAQRMEMAALVLSPTRELARQTATMFNQLGRSSGIRVATIVGGAPLSDDWKALASWPNVLVATPGRLIDHIASATVALGEVEVLVVDEADRMHDMGFMPQVRRILEALPPERQTLMLTATMPPEVERIARRHMRDPAKVQIGRRSAPAERATHRLFLVKSHQKDELLVHLVGGSVERGGVYDFAGVVKASKKRLVVLALKAVPAEVSEAERSVEEPEVPAERVEELAHDPAFIYKLGQAIEAAGVVGEALALPYVHHCYDLYAPLLTRCILAPSWVSRFSILS